MLKQTGQNINLDQQSNNEDENAPINKDQNRNIDEDEEEDDDEEQKDQLNANQGKTVSAEKERSFARSITIGKILCFLIIIFDIGFAQFLCMFRNICDFQGVEITEAYGQTVIIFLFITLGLTLIIYYLIDTLNKSVIKNMRYLVIVWAILVIVFAGFSFYELSNIKTSDIQEIWDSLTPFSQDYYDSDIEQLLDINKTNLLWSSIYNLTNGILMLLLFGVVNNLESNMPAQWRPQTQIVNPGCEGKGFTIWETRKKNLRKRLKDQFKFQDDKNNRDILDDTTNKYKKHKKLQQEDIDEERPYDDPKGEGRNILREGPVRQPY